MEHTEDLSARVLLRHILTTEPPRTPVSRSPSKAPTGTTVTRRSSRLENKNAGAQTPQDMLRRSLKHKMRESITRKSLPPPKRRTASVVLKRIDTPAAASMLFDDGDTPRHILKNILLTEPVRTPVVHERVASEEPQVPSANSSITRRSTELSGFDLPDLTIGNVISTAKGLSRKRPRRSLNVTAFEKRLRDGDGEDEEQNEESVRENSSLSLSGSTSLSLKTPFVDVHTEKRGLQRRVSNRRKITVEEFGAAVNKRHIGELSSIMQPDQGPSETAFSEGFTLGLSKLSEPDITTDIVHCSTALYAQPDATTTNHSMVATQDKPTVMASQLQRQVLEMEEEELSRLRKERSMYAFPTEDEDVGKHQEEERGFEPQEKEESRAADEAVVVSQEEDKTKSKVDEGGETAETEEEEEAVEAQTEEEEVADSQTEEEEDDRVDDEPEEEEEEAQLDTQTQEEEEDGVVDDEPETEEEVVQTESQSQEEEEEEDGGVDDEPETEEEVQTESQSQEEEEDGGADDESEKEEEDQTESQSQEEEGGIDSQSEREDAVDSQTEKEVELESQEEEEEADSQTAGGEEESVASQIEGEENLADSQNPGDEDQADEEGAAGSQTEEEEAVDSLPEEVGEEEHTENKSVEKGKEGGEEEEEEEGDAELASTHLDDHIEHISRRAHRSEAGLFVPATVDEKDSEDVSELRLSDGKSKAHTTFEIRNSLELESHDSGPHQAGTFDVPESSTQGGTDASSKEPELDADKENSSTPARVTHDIEYNQPADEASAQEEEEWEEEEDDDEETEDIPSKTPAFVRQRMSLLRPDPQASPSVLKNIQASSSTDGEGLAGPQPKQVRRRRSGPQKKRIKGCLPKSYLMGIFKHFAKTKVSADVYPVLQEIMDKFFSRMAEDLETYAIHAKRKTIEVEDAELLLRRQGHVNDKVPVEVLIEKYLRMDQRRLLIPVATSGNVVLPKKRR